MFSWNLSFIVQESLEDDAEIEVHQGPSLLSTLLEQYPTSPDGDAHREESPGAEAENESDGEDEYDYPVGGPPTLSAAHSSGRCAMASTSFVETNVAIPRTGSPRDDSVSVSTDIIARNIEVPLQRYYLVLDIKGLLIAEHHGYIGDDLKTKIHIRARPGLLSFLEFCTANFEVVFWSTVSEKNLDRHFQKLLAIHPLLRSNYRRLPGYWCDISTRNNSNGKREYLLKRLDRLFCDTRLLARSGASVQNTLLVDDRPYRNVLNHPFSAVHPNSFFWDSAECKEPQPTPNPYLTRVVTPFLAGLKQSGLDVQEYCRKNSSVGKPRLFPESREYQKYREVIPSHACGFDVPGNPGSWFVNLPCPPEAPGSSIVGGQPTD